MVTFRQRDKVQALLADAVGLAEIARRTRVPPRLVRKIAKAANLLPPPPPPKPPRHPKTPKPAKAPNPHRVAPWQYGLALSMLRAGATCLAASDHAGIGDKTAARIARANYFYVRPRGRPKGETGVPLPVRAAALRLVAEGATYRAAGEAVGVSKQRVHQWAQEEGVKVGKGRKRKARRPATLAKAPEMA